MKKELNPKFMNFLGKLESVSSPADKAIINNVRGKYAAMMFESWLDDGLNSKAGSKFLKDHSQSGYDEFKVNGMAPNKRGGLMRQLKTAAARLQKAGDEEGAAKMLAKIERLRKEFDTDNEIRRQNTAIRNDAATHLQQGEMMIDNAMQTVLKYADTNPAKVQVWLQTELIPEIKKAAKYGSKGNAREDETSDEYEKLSSVAKRNLRSTDRNDIAGLLDEDEKQKLFDQEVKQGLKEKRGTMNAEERAAYAKKHGLTVDERRDEIDDEINALMTKEDEFTNADQKKVDALKKEKENLGKRSTWGKLKAWLRGEAVDAVMGNPALFESLTKCTDTELMAVCKRINAMY